MHFGLLHTYVCTYIRMYIHTSSARSIAVDPNGLYHVLNLANVQKTPIISLPLNIIITYTLTFKSMHNKAIFFVMLIYILLSFSLKENNLSFWYIRSDNKVIRLVDRIRLLILLWLRTQARLSRPRSPKRGWKF